MGATLDQFDTIDFSDNDIRKLENFPFLPRLKNLLLNNNRIARIADDLAENLPNLESVILTGNNIIELGDVEPLTKFEKLESLCLMTNPIAAKPYYREYIACKFPNLRLLDFRKIKRKERDAAKLFFKSAKGKEVLREIIKRSKIAATAEINDNKPKPIAASNAEIQKIKEAIRKASTLQEVERLTRLLESGRINQEFGENGNGNGDAVVEEEDE